jgi:hypothetical protein
MARIWRYQPTPHMQRRPSWEGWRTVDPYATADPEWPGYWWATGTDPETKHTSYLVRASDVERARSGLPVDTYHAGLSGCTDPSDLLLYIESVTGGLTPDDDSFVALYEGRIVFQADGYVIFEPVELLQAWPAYQWYQLQKQGQQPSQ